MTSATITGLSGSDFIRIDALSGLRAAGFAVTAHVNNCTVTHDFIEVFPPAAFLADLREFERSRSGTATIQGSPHFTLTIGPYRTLGAAFLRFEIGDPQMFLCEATYGSLSFSAGFVIPGEFVSTALRDLESLFANATFTNVA
jgi:hypothetical protein